MIVNKYADTNTGEAKLKLDFAKYFGELIALGYDDENGDTLLVRATGEG